MTEADLPVSGLIFALNPENREPQLIRYEDIVTVTTSDRKVLISTAIRSYIYKGSFSRIEEILSRTGYFLKCNRSTMVNLKMIIRLEQWSNMRMILHMQGFEKQRITLSRNYLNEFRRMVGL